jgi:hypothetical protein
MISAFEIHICFRLRFWDMFITSSMKWGWVELSSMRHLIYPSSTDRASAVSWPSCKRLFKRSRCVWKLLICGSCGEVYLWYRWQLRVESISSSILYARGSKIVESYFLKLLRCTSSNSATEVESSIQYGTEEEWLHLQAPQGFYSDGDQRQSYSSEHWCKPSSSICILVWNILYLF